MIDDSDKSNRSLIFDLELLICVLRFLNRQWNFELKNCYNFNIFLAQV